MPADGVPADGVPVDAVPVDRLTWRRGRRDPTEGSCTVVAWCPAFRRLPVGARLDPGVDRGRPAGSGAAPGVGNWAMKSVALGAWMPPTARWVLPAAEPDESKLRRVWAITKPTCAAIRFDALIVRELGDAGAQKFVLWPGGRSCAPASGRSRS